MRFVHRLETNVPYPPEYGVPDRMILFWLFGFTWPGGREYGVPAELALFCFIRPIPWTDWPFYRIRHP